MHRLQRGNSSRRGRAEGLTRPSFQQCSYLCIPPPCRPRVVARDLAGFWMAGVLLFFNPLNVIPLDPAAAAAASCRTYCFAA